MKTTKKRQAGRKYVALRMDLGLFERVSAVAKNEQSNPRIIIEVCVEKHLPELEQRAGIVPMDDSLKSYRSRSAPTRKVSNG